MEIILSADLTDFVQRKVQSGTYRDPAEVVQAGLRLLQEQEQKKADLRRDVDIGLEQANQGNVAPLNQEMIDKIKLYCRQRRQSNREPS
jgi:antitoxin ParD1/3/4